MDVYGNYDARIAELISGPLGIEFNEAGEVSVFYDFDGWVL